MVICLFDRSAPRRRPQLSLEAFSRSFFSTLICEEFFNICRRQSSLSRNKKLELENIYHSASVGRSF